ncbi:unnamed protein product [Rhizophagus irregularis]|nr:unnamed protein product [Rhizophagus irregularis]
MSEWASLGIHWLSFLFNSAYNMVSSPVGFSEESNSPHLESYLGGLKLGYTSLGFILPSSLRTYNTMSTPKAPSVINSDIPPPPRPDTSAPSGDRPLSPIMTLRAQ